MTEGYRPLGFPFTKNGWTHELVAREGLVLLVRRHKKGIPAHFEVIRLRRQSARTFKRALQEISLPAMEVYPASEDWGTYGFTYRTLEEAKQRMEKMTR